MLHSRFKKILFIVILALNFFVFCSFDALSFKKCLKVFPHSLHNTECFADEIQNREKAERQPERERLRRDGIDEESPTDEIIIMKFTRDNQSEYGSEEILKAFPGKSEIRVRNSWFLGKFHYSDMGNRFITPDRKIVYLRKTFPDDFRANIEVIVKSLNNGEIKFSKLLYLVFNRNFSGNPRINNNFSSDGNILLCINHSSHPVYKKDRQIFDSKVVLFHLDKNEKDGYKKKDLEIGYIYNNQPRISPDKKYIIAHLPVNKDGKKILYTERDIVLIETSGQGKIRIPKCRSDEQEQHYSEDKDCYLEDYKPYWNECWSPDSSKILFARSDRNLKGTVSILDIDTGIVETILIVENAWADWRDSFKQYTDWEEKMRKKDFPELEKNYISRNWNPELEWTDKGILITCDDGLYLKRNNEERVVKLDIPGNIKHFYNGRLSPDGNRILFIGQQNNDINIYVYDIQSGKLIKGTLPPIKETRDEYQAAWLYKDRNSFIRNREYSSIGTRVSREFLKQLQFK